MKKVIVYCASGYAERVAYSLNKDLFTVVAFSDSNPETWGRKLYAGGGTVIPPSEIKNTEYDMIIIALSRYAEEIKKSLVEEYEVNADTIFVYRPEVEGLSYREWEEERIVMLRRCIAILKERNIAGNMAEVGVYRGDFARLMNAYMPDRTLYLFDTFEGFDTQRDEVREVDRKQFLDTSADYVLERMPVPEKCVIRKGYFPDTAEGLEDTFSLVSLDCDLYNPILAGLRYFYPRLSKGGYIFVHDFGSYHYAGVKDAVYEFCAERGAAVVPLTDLCLTAIIAK